MVKVSDYVVDFLHKKEINDVFMVSGGMIMHLIDSLGRHKGMKYYCNYHEQACAISAEGYARMTGKPGVCFATVGPGAVNALAGMVGAWYDSIPMIVISGTVRSSIISDFSKVRQFGPQEADIMAMIKPVTKYSVTINNADSIQYEMEKAYEMATSGRPGPVWVEIPLDIQSAQVDEKNLVAYAEKNQAKDIAPDIDIIKKDVKAVADLIEKAKRPLIIAGSGFRISRSIDSLYDFMHEFKVPATIPFSAKDTLAEDEELYVGLFGTAGQRRANFAVQNCDLILSFASGLNLTKVGFNFAGFAPRAKKVIVDIDHNQVFNQVIKPDLGIVSDIRIFMQMLTAELRQRKMNIDPRWYEAIQMWKRRYPVMVEEFYSDKENVNSYVFVDRLADQLKAEDCVIMGNGLDSVSIYQAFKVKRGQRVAFCGNWGSMGWELPLAVGASIGRGKARTVCVTGDGSFQWNIQEMMTAQFHKLPLKIFIFNNRGYTAIRSTQTNLTDGLFVGSDESSGVGSLDFAKLADTYGFGYARIDNNDQVSAGVEKALHMSGPVLCEVKIHPEQWISPKASAFKRADGTLESRPLEDMAPFLPREEIVENMSLFND